MAGELPANFAEIAAQIASEAHDQAATVASRKASQLALEGLTAALPELLGGSADLTGSNLTNTKSTPALRVDAKGAVVKTEDGQIGRHINYGVREFGMAAIMNGVALHGGYIPYGGTFLTFSDYSRNAIRMAALMKQRVVHRVHARLHRPGRRRPDAPADRARRQPAPDPRPGRLAPVPTPPKPPSPGPWPVPEPRAPTRPAADAPEPALCCPRAKRRWTTSPTAATCCPSPRTCGLKGKKAKAVIIATGSEVQLALDAQKQLAEQGVAVRVVSMPSTTTFDRQDADYQASVLPKGLPRVAVEMGVTATAGGNTAAPPWSASTRYGESAPAAVLFKHFGFTADNVAATGAGGVLATSNVFYPVSSFIYQGEAILWLSKLVSTVLAASVVCVFRAAVAELLPTSKWLASTTCCEPDYLAYMLQVRQRARPLQGRREGRRRQPGRQRQNHPPDRKNVTRPT